MNNCSHSGINKESLVFLLEIAVSKSASSSRNAVGLFALGFILLLTSGCASTALPSRSPDLTVAKAVLASEKAAAKAIESAESAHQDAAEIAGLMKRLEDLSARTITAQRECAAIAAKIQTKKKAIIRSRRLRNKIRKGKPAKGVAEPAKPKGPEYSPSDAPVSYRAPRNQPLRTPAVGELPSKEDNQSASISISGTSNSKRSANSENPAKSVAKEASVASK